MKIHVQKLKNQLISYKIIFFHLIIKKLYHTHGTYLYKVKKEDIFQFKRDGVNKCLKQLKLHLSLNMHITC